MLVPQLLGNCILATTQAGTEYLVLHSRPANMFGLAFVARARIEPFQLPGRTQLRLLLAFREGIAGFNAYRKQAADFTTLIPTFYIRATQPLAFGLSGTSQASPVNIDVPPSYDPCLPHTAA